MDPNIRNAQRPAEQMTALSQIEKVADCISAPSSSLFLAAYPDSAAAPFMESPFKG